MTTIHELSTLNQDPSTLTHLLALSRSVFNPDTPEADLPHHHSRENWETQLALPHARILYASPNTLDSPFSEPIAFFFILPRTHPEIGHELLHIRLAAVSPESRGQGVFPLLMARAKQYARECGYGGMTVCTFPEKFGRMWRILRGSGWEVVAEVGDEGKVLLKIGV